MNSILPDIYFSSFYGKLYEDSKSKFHSFDFKCSYGRVVNNFLIREIDSIVYELDDQYYDIITPYGYGGPVVIDCKSDMKNELLDKYNNAFSIFCKENNIITEVVKFHPVLKNHKIFESYYTMDYVKKTVYMNLMDCELIWSNMKGTSRNRIRNFDKIDVSINMSNNQLSLENFKKLYYRTMDRNNAEEFYYFGDEYFNNLFNNLKDNFIIFSLLKGDKVIASALVFKWNRNLHYHLGATDPAYYDLSPNNYLFYQIGLWGHNNGYNLFHLGGGRSNRLDDTLLRFKKTLSIKTDLLDFVIGKKVWNNEKYLYLKRIFESKNKIDTTERLFPEYR